MCILPLVERELRAATRRRLTYWARAAAAVAAVVVGGVLLNGLENWQGGGSVGRQLFHLVAKTAFLLSLLAGALTTATGICEERRWGTLELLLLTELRPLNVVLGKLTTSSLNALQTLLGIVPVLALCLILGGVSLGEFWRMVALLTTTIGFSLSAGILVSTVSWHSGRARAGTMGLVLVVGLVLLGADQILVGEMARWGVGSILPGIFQAYTHVYDERYALPPGDFWWSLGFTALLALCFLWQAGRKLPQGVLMNPQQMPADALREKIVRWLTGEPSDAIGFRLTWLKKNPMFWWASRRRWPWLRLWGWLLGVLAAWMAVAWYIGFSQGQIDYLVMLLLPLGLHLVLKVAVGAEATRRLNELRRSGELELLLTTPLRPGRISRGLVLAMKRQFKVPILLILCLDMLILCFGGELSRAPEPALIHLLYSFFGLPPLSRTPESVGEGTRLLILWALMAPLILDLRAMAWSGLWLGLRSSTVSKAFGRALYRVIIEPSALFLLTLPIAPTLWVGGLTLGAPEGFVVGGTVWWMIVGGGSGTVLAMGAKRKLDREFRHFAAFRFGH